MLTKVELDTVGSGREAVLSHMFEGTAAHDIDARDEYLLDGKAITYDLTDVGIGGLAQMDFMFKDAFTYDKFDIAN